MHFDKEKTINETFKNKRDINKKMREKKKRKACFSSVHFFFNHISTYYMYNILPSICHSYILIFFKENWSSLLISLEFTGPKPKSQIQ